MRINLREYQKNKVFKKNEEFIIPLEQLSEFNGDDFEFIDDVKVNANIEISQDLVKLKLDISTRLKFVCSRCLTNFVHDLKMECDDEILLSNLDEDIILDSDQNLDFTDYIKNCVIISIPQQKLCKSDCLGLCQQCGIDLNNDTCSCDKHQFNNVFSQLRETFGDLKEVE